MKPTVLVMVSNNNNNKIYRMNPNGDTFTVEYGRIGTDSYQTTSYPISQWNKKYNEKVRKGYIDRSDLLEELIVKEKPKNKEYIDIENKAIAEIVERLQSMAKQAIRDNYTISSNKVTQKMVDEAQIALNNLLIIDDIDIFNKKLIELFSIIPRKMNVVANFLAKLKDDFIKIIQREQDLLDVMAGQVIQHDIVEEHDEIETTNDITILEALGLEFYETDFQEIKTIKTMLGDQSYKYHNSWKIINKNTQNRFEKFVKDNNIKDTRLFFHGSRNENFFSIISTGLLIRPSNAVYTGSMFGDAIYSSNSASKSLGYSSLSGSKWTNGNANFGFLALFDTAYGNPYYVYNFDSKYYNFDYKKLQEAQSDANCLHARSDKGMLRADEIVFYNHNQLTIKYLIEMRS